MNNKHPEISLSGGKQHFEILDGLRGMAALAVVIFHFMEFVVPDYHHNFIAHSYLAVDFFFCLSGYVIAYAYDSKIKTIGIWRFLKLRLIRLHPLVVVGAVIGLLVFIFDPFSNLFAVYGIWQAFLMFLSSCLLIPYPIVTERYYNLFHLNPPTWSLFWEYIANVAYALVFFRLRNKVLCGLILVAAAGLCYEAYTSKYLGVGWGGENIAGGGIRVLYSFLAGMLVYRSKWIIKNRLGFLGLAVMLCLSFLFPFSEKVNFITDPVIVIFYFPLLIALGAGASLKMSYSKLCKFSGEISYPLYMIHYPFLWLFLSYLEKVKPGVGEIQLIIPIAVMLLLALAYGVLKFVDVPIRKCFSARG